MDDAGGGRRGTRAVVSAELWQVLAARWAIPRQHGHDLGGSVNLNLLVRRGGEQLVARVHRPSVTPARLADIQAIRDRLDAAGVPCQALVAACDGARRAHAAGRLVEVERFIGHDGQMNTPPRLARGLPLLGRIHTLLAEAGGSRRPRPPSSPTTSSPVPSWRAPGPGQPGSGTGSRHRTNGRWPATPTGSPTWSPPEKRAW